MKSSWAILAVCALTLIIFAVRLTLSITTPYFSDDASYFTVRQLDHILEHGKPFSEDSFVFGGRQVIVQPYWYLLVPLAKITSSSTAIKIFSNVVGSFLILCVFFMALAITKSPTASLFSGIAMALSPIFVTTTINTANPLGLVMMLVILSIYFLFKSSLADEPQSRWLYFIAALLSYMAGIILHISASILLAGLLLFLILSRTEKISAPKIYEQYWITCFTLTLWLMLLFYRDVLLMHGFSSFYQNIPFELRANNFLENNVFVLIGTIGVLPLLAAIYAFLQTAELRKFRGIFIVSSLGLSALGLGLLTIIPLVIAGAYIAVASSILVSPAYMYLQQATGKMKITVRPAILATTVFLALLITLGGPIVASALQETRFLPQPDQGLAEFLSTVEPSAIIIASPNYGQFLVYQTQRSVAFDENFLLVPDAQQRYASLGKIYSSKFINDVLVVTNSYGTGKTSPGYIVSRSPLPAAPSVCLEEVFRNANHYVYRTDCQVIGSV